MGIDKKSNLDLSNCRLAIRITDPTYRLSIDSIPFDFY